MILCVVAYTAHTIWERDDPSRPWQVRSEHGVIQVRELATTDWRGQWDGGPWIVIPGARPLLAHEAALRGLRSHARYGMNYKIIAPHRRAALPAFDEWCRRVGDSALGVGGECWISGSVWAERHADPLAMLFIPELDESRQELRAVSRAERLCREAQARLEDAQRLRLDAVVTATRRRQHSRRVLAEAAGLSFARIQQLLQTPGS